MVRLSRGVLSVVFLFVLASLASAQTSVRYYVVPKIGDGTITNTFRPKYIDLDALGAGWNVGAWRAMDYGDEAVFLVALNLTTPDHTTLAAQPDVIAVPAPITDTVSGAAVNTIKSKLEGAKLPSDWVTTSLTYKQVLGTVMRTILFMQRYQGFGFGRFFDLVDKNGVPITLDTTFSQLTAAEKTQLQNVAASLNLDTSGFTATSKIRQILKGVADQLYPTGIAFAGDVF